MKNKILLLAIALLPLYTMAQDTLQEPVMFVLNMPSYPGGEMAVMQELYKNVVYPEYEKSMNIEGTVFVNFVVEKDGTPSHFKVARGVAGGAGLDSAAISACRKLGKFNPGTQNGVPQRVYLCMPVKFTLGAFSPFAELGFTAEELEQFQKDAKFICEIIDNITELEIQGDKATAEIYRKSLDSTRRDNEKKYANCSLCVIKIEEFVHPCYAAAMERSSMTQQQIQEEIKLSNREIKDIKKDAEYICDMMSKFVEAEKDNDQKRIESLTAEFDDKAAYLQKKYPKGSAMEKQLDELVKPCLEEAMKAAMEK
jgi:TonB family protein